MTARECAFGLAPFEAYDHEADADELAAEREDDAEYSGRCAELAHFAPFQLRAEDRSLSHVNCNDRATAEAVADALRKSGHAVAVWAFAVARHPSQYSGYSETRL